MTDGVFGKVFSVRSTESPLRRYLRAVSRQAWIVLVVPVLTLSATFAFVESRAPVYRASATLVVGTRTRSDLRPELATGGVARTMTNLLESDLLARQVIRTHRLDISVEDFLENLRADVLPRTSVIEVTYDSTEPRVAVTVVAELSRIFARQVSNTLGPGSGRGERRAGSFGIVVQEFDPPHVEPQPLARDSSTSLIFAGVAGLVAGALVAVARAALDSRIHSRHDAEVGFGAPVLAALPRGLNRRPAPGAAVDGKPDKRAASLDLLRAQLQFNRPERAAGSTILVTGAGPRSGTAAVAANLAAALARAGERVVCVDADARRAALHKYLGIAGDTPGLVDVLESRVDLEDALIRVELAPPTTNATAPAQPRGRLDILHAGSGSSRPNLLTLETVERLLSLLREHADYIVLDSPTPLVSDFFPLAVNSDDVLLVARRGWTTKAQAEAARATLEGLGVANVGVVLTDARAGDD